MSWVRRTRIDGDLWFDADVPLGEDEERYLLRIQQGASVLREVEVTMANWTYTAANVLADVGNSDFVVSVAQVSARYGPGPFRHLPVSQQ